MDEQKARLDAMELEKERKIRLYMQLQDQADAMSEKIYKTCCDVEALNLQIDVLKDEIKKAALKGLKPGNGVQKPANGNGGDYGHANGTSH